MYGWGVDGSLSVALTRDDGAFLKVTASIGPSATSGYHLQVSTYLGT